MSCQSNQQQSIPSQLNKLNEKLIAGQPVIPGTPSNAQQEHIRQSFEARTQLHAHELTDFDLAFNAPRHQQQIPHHQNIPLPFKSNGANIVERGNINNRLWSREFHAADGPRDHNLQLHNDEQMQEFERIWMLKEQFQVHQQQVNDNSDQNNQAELLEEAWVRAREDSGMNEDSHSNVLLEQAWNNLRIAEGGDSIDGADVRNGNEEDLRRNVREAGVDEMRLAARDFLRQVAPVAEQNDKMQQSKFMSWMKMLESGSLQLENGIIVDKQAATGGDKVV